MIYSVNSGSKNNNKKIKTVWRTIKEYANYMVSNKGDVYSKLTKKIMSKQKIGKYYRIKFESGNIKKTVAVHILVAKAFITNPKKLPKVDHIDNNTFNNNVKNLRWITSSGNALSYQRNFRKFIPVLQYDIDGNFIKKWDSITKIIDTYPNYNRGNIYNSLRITNKTAYGYIWKYEYKKKKKQSN